MPLNESIVNKTALSRQTNIRIGKRSPAEYLPKIEKDAKVSPAVLDEIVSSHAINPKHLRVADFDGFFAERVQALLGLVEMAMGKRAVRTDETVGEEGELPASFDAESEEPDDDPQPLEAEMEDDPAVRNATP